MTARITHPSILATATAGVVLALAATVTHVPTWLWVAWAVLGAAAVVQAARSSS